jgi:hypothetical protein
LLFGLDGCLALLRNEDFRFRHPVFGPLHVVPGAGSSMSWPAKVRRRIDLCEKGSASASRWRPFLLAAILLVCFKYRASAQAAYWTSRPETTFGLHQRSSFVNRSGRWPRARQGGSLAAYGHLRLTSAENRSLIRLISSAGTGSISCSS